MKFLLCFLLVSHSVCLSQTGGNKLTEVTLLRGPYLQVDTTSSIVIRWRTNVPVISKVQYGNSPTNLNKQIRHNQPVKDHIVKIEGLKPDTKYYYAISDSEKKLQGDKDNSFLTLP